MLSKITSRSRAAALTAVAAISLAGCAVGQGGGDSGGSDAAGPSGAEQASVAFEQAPGFTTIDQSLVDAARAEGGSLVWYESSPEGQVAQVIEAFRRDFPFVERVEHVRLRAADVASRVAQEAQAGAPTADVATSDAASLGELEERDLLREADWAGAGVPEQLAPSPALISTAASVFVIVHNTNEVPDNEAPQGWDALLDQQWAGRIGVWNTPIAIAELVPAWGEQRTLDYNQRLNGQQPVTYESTFPLAQAVGAGEIALGVGIFHSTQPAIEQGAPIGVVVPDPTPVTMLYSAVPDAARNPMTAQLFSAWLTSEAGQSAYESATHRGNPQLPGTEAAELIGDRQISTFSADRAGELSDWLDQLSAG